MFVPDTLFCERKFPLVSKKCLCLYRTSNRWMLALVKFQFHAYFRPVPERWLAGSDNRQKGVCVWLFWIQCEKNKEKDKLKSLLRSKYKKTFTGKIETGRKPKSRNNDNKNSKKWLVILLQCSLLISCYSVWRLLATYTAFILRGTNSTKRWTYSAGIFSFIQE